MKCDKGFVGMGVVIAVMIALVFSGGVVYYATKTKAPSVEDVDKNKYQPVGQDYALTKTATNHSSSVAANEQMGMKLYSGSKFSLSYPNEYTLTKNSDGITITSIPFRKIDTAKCQQLEDRQARGYCLNPARGMSPLITIKFLAGNSNDLWGKAIMADSRNRTFVVSSKYTYKYNHISDEFGGEGSYGLLLSNGLLLAEYAHDDVDGGNRFIESSEYRLDQYQQKELLEQILKTLVIK